MKPTEKIMELIEQGDPITILAEGNLVECFNELLRYQLIDVVNEKVVLTKKGEQAKLVGLDRFLEDLKIKEELKEFSFEVQQKENLKFRWCLTLFLTLIALFIAVTLTDCTVILDK